MPKLRAGVVVFLGTNCDRDTKSALEAAGFKAQYVFHTEENLQNFDLVVLPGGFSFGDYIRAGRLAKLSPVVFALKNYVKQRRGFVLGICNGFQILTESGILPGALIENRSTKFISEFTKSSFLGNDVILPIAHKEGCFWADNTALEAIEKEKMAIIRYKTPFGGLNSNPNGSIQNIAGLYDAKQKVFGLMPHPERAVNKAMGSTDGFKIFDFIKKEILR